MVVFCPGGKVCLDRGGLTLVEVPWWGGLTCLGEGCLVGEGCFTNDGLPWYGKLPWCGG